MLCIGTPQVPQYTICRENCLPLNWNLVFIRWIASAFGSLRLSVRGGGGGSSLNAGARLAFGDISSASYESSYV